MIKAQLPNPWHLAPGTWHLAPGTWHLVSAPGKKHMRDPLSRVRSIALKLPDVEEGTTFGFPAFKVGGKAFAWFPKKKEVEPGSLGIRMSILEREFRIKEKPEAFYVTPHYVDYTSVLARVDELNAKELKELLESGHEFMTAAAKAKKKRPR